MIAVGRAAERSTAASCGNALHRACACAGSEYPAPATGRTHQVPLDLRRPLEIGNISAAGLHSPRAEQPSDQEAAGRSQVAAKRSSARRAIKCLLGRTSTASSQAPQPGDHIHLDPLVRPMYEISRSKRLLYWDQSDRHRTSEHLLPPERLTKPCPRPLRKFNDPRTAKKQRTLFTCEPILVCNIAKCWLLGYACICTKFRPNIYRAFLLEFQSCLRAE